MKKDNNSGRRSFFGKLLASLGLPFLLGSCAEAETKQKKKVKTEPLRTSKTVIAGLSSSSPSRKQYRKKLDKALIEITGEKKPADAWAKLFSPEDTVAIKVNSLAGRKLSPAPELAYSVADAVASAGVPENEIIICDRKDRELRAAGYKLNKEGDGYRCFGTDALRGSGYQSEPKMSGEVGSCFSKIFTEHATAIVNVPILKDHDLAGLSGGMKNFYGIIHNPNKYHDNNCSPYVAHLNNHPIIKDKHRLTVMDATTAQYNGGPAYVEKWTWDAGKLIIGTDPVAADRLSWDIIEDKRKKEGLKSLKEAERKPIWLEEAAKLGLGEINRSEIEVMEI